MGRADEDSHAVPDLRGVVVLVFRRPELAEPDDRTLVDQDQDLASELRSEVHVAPPVPVSGTRHTHRGHVIGNVPHIRRHPSIRMDLGENVCVIGLSAPDLHVTNDRRRDRSDRPGHRLEGAGRCRCLTQPPKTVPDQLIDVAVPRGRSEVTDRRTLRCVLARRTSRACRARPAPTFALRRQLPPRAVRSQAGSGLRCSPRNRPRPTRR